MHQSLEANRVENGALTVMVGGDQAHFDRADRQLMRLHVHAR